MDGVTIALVTHNEEANLPRALRSLLPHRATSFPWEILIIDNGSRDGTELVVQEFAHANPAVAVRWVRRELNHLGRARAMAIELAKFPLVGFIDADCAAPPLWMETFFHEAKLLGRSDVLALGGGNAAPASTPFYRAHRIAFPCWIGSLSVWQARRGAARRHVKHLPTCNAFYYREVALALGNFSRDFGDVCEDLELSLRAARRGYAQIYLPGLEVAHHHRPSFARWAEKMFRYGRGQMYVARRYPEHLLGSRGLLLLGSMLGIAFLFSRPAPLRIFAVIGGYLAMLGIFSLLRCAKNQEVKLAPKVFSLLLTTHVFYAMGELWGAVSFWPKDRRKMKDGE